MFGQNGTVKEPRRPYALVVYAKEGPARFVGHLDLARAFDRAVRRARIPVAYSEGYNPRAKIAFASPLPVGVAGQRELCAMDLVQWADADVLHQRLAAQMPAGLRIVAVSVEGRGRRSPLADISHATYLADLRLQAASVNQLDAAVGEMLKSPNLNVLRESGREAVRVDVRPAVLGLELVDKPARLRMRLRILGEPSVRPQELIALLDEWLGGNALEIAGLTRLELW